MKEYNLKDSTVGTNLPTQYGALKKIKNFLRLDLTAKQEKVFWGYICFKSYAIFKNRFNCKKAY